MKGFSSVDGGAGDGCRGCRRGGWLGLCTCRSRLRRRQWDQAACSETEAGADRTLARRFGHFGGGGHLFAAQGGHVQCLGHLQGYPGHRPRRTRPGDGGRGVSRSRRNSAPITNLPFASLRMITRSGSVTSGWATHTPPSEGRPSHRPASVTWNTSGASTSRSTSLTVLDRFIGASAPPRPRVSFCKGRISCRLRIQPKAASQILKANRPLRTLAMPFPKFHGLASLFA